MSDEKLLICNMKLLHNGSKSKKHKREPKEKIWNKQQLNRLIPSIQINVLEVIMK